MAVRVADETDEQRWRNVEHEGAPTFGDRDPVADPSASPWSGWAAGRCCPLAAGGELGKPYGPQPTPTQPAGLERPRASDPRAEPTAARTDVSPTPTGRARVGRQRRCLSANHRDRHR